MGCENGLRLSLGEISRSGGDKLGALVSAYPYL
jgi:hypothetical protein